MKAVKVQYTVNEGFVAQNKINIRKIMDALKERPIDGMLYSSYTMEDGNTFLHINISRDEQTMAKLNELPEFKIFRTALKASHPMIPPQATRLHFVGAAFEL